MGAITICVGPFAAADAPGSRANHARSAASPNAQDLVFLGPTGPLFVRMTIDVNGKGFRKQHAEQLDQMFSELDTDADGSLDEAESRHIPSPGQLQSIQQAEAIDLGLIRKISQDGLITRDELEGYIRNVMGDPFHIQWDSSREARAANLFRRLDLDRNERLSPAEFAATPETLRKRDLDDDELFSIEELTPFATLTDVSRRASAARDQRDELPLKTVNDQRSFDELAKQLLLRYGSRSDEQGVGLTASQIGLSDQDMTHFDRDRNGALDHSELVELLGDPPVDLKIAVQIPNPITRRPKISMTKPLSNRVTDFEQVDSKRLKFRLDGIDFEAVVKSRPGNTFDNRQFYMLKFLTSDGDKNGYLTMEEFPAVGVPDTTFQMVDRDGDGMVVRNELIEYVNQEARASRSRLNVTIGRKGETLFELIDADSDGRLAPRELSAAWSRLESHDRDGDSELAPPEIAGSYSIDFELGKPRLFIDDRGMMAPAEMSSQVIPNTNALSGPEWFRKMDRNRDGDVSRREFLGPIAVFKKIDTDGDQLLSLDEAKTADSKPTASSPAENKQ